MAKNGFEVVAYMYDVNNVEFAVKETATGRYWAEGFSTPDEAEQELAAIVEEMHAFNNGPFSSAQCK